MLQLVLLDDFIQNIVKIGVKYIHTGQIDGYRKSDAVLIPPDCDLPACFCPHIFIQRTDQTALFEKRNEDRRRDQQPDKKRTWDHGQYRRFLE